MKIAVDLRWVASDTGGIRRYVLSLVKNLAVIDKKNVYLLVFSDRKILEEVFDDYGLNGRENFSGKVFEPGPFSLRSQFQLPGFLKREGVQVFHSPDFIAPVFLKNIELVITMHDLIPYIHPGLCPRSKKVKFLLLYRMFNRLVIKRARIILTVSENSKRDIVSVFGIDGSRVRVICNGVGESYRVIEDSNLIGAVRKEYGLSERNILYTGRQGPAKNITGLIRSFKKLREKKGFNGSLVIAGKKDDRYPEPYELVESLGLGKHVIFTGYVDERKLPLLYNACDLFVFPSYYEGFGLPPLEAMACGVPVISSGTSSMPEILGGAGLLVQPDNIDEMVQSMDRVLREDSLRKDMIKKGLKRAGLFSWKDTAVKTLAEYELLT